MPKFDILQGENRGEKYCFFRVLLLFQPEYEFDFSIFIDILENNPVGLTFIFICSDEQKVRIITLYENYRERRQAMDENYYEEFKIHVCINKFHTSAGIVATAAKYIYEDDASRRYEEAYECVGGSMGSLKPHIVHSISRSTDQAAEHIARIFESNIITNKNISYDFYKENL